MHFEHEGYSIGVIVDPCQRLISGTSQPQISQYRVGGMQAELANL